MNHPIKIDPPFKCIYPFQMLASIGWPPQVDHNGTMYRKTGKGGLRAATNIPCAEYATEKDRRLWLMADGTIEED